jgi:hypothetical protein
MEMLVVGIRLVASIRGNVPYLRGISQRGGDALRKWFKENDLWLGDARSHARRVGDIFLEIETHHLV